MPQRRYGLGDSPDQRQPVRWFEPSVLASAGLEVAFSAFQNRNLDRRESFGVTALEGVDSGIDFRDGKQDFWFDFVSDCGDGGNATYSVMHTLLRDQVWCGSEELPRGSLLVLGGDLSYPQASSEEY